MAQQLILPSSSSRFSRAAIGFIAVMVKPDCCLALRKAAFLTILTSIATCDLTHPFYQNVRPDKAIPNGISEDGILTPQLLGLAGALGVRRELVRGFLTLRQNPGLLHCANCRNTETGTLQQLSQILSRAIADIAKPVDTLTAIILAVQWSKSLPTPSWDSGLPMASGISVSSSRGQWYGCCGQ
eukprot:140115-Amphidinium_carterae.1